MSEAPTKTTDKMSLLFESDGKTVTISDGKGGDALVTRAFAAQICFLELDAVLAGPPCDCPTCGLLRMAQEALKPIAGIVRYIEGRPPYVLEKSKLC